MRAIWSGHITFGLISIPVGLYSAIEASEQVRFRMLHRKDMSPIRFKKFCSEEDVEVPGDEIVKGFEVSRGKFAIVEDKDLEEVQEAIGGDDDDDHAIDILQFVEFSSINPLFIEKPYYLAPQKGGAKAYGVLREALNETRHVGIARFRLRTKPILAALAPSEKALSLAVLRRYEEIRDPSELPLPDGKVSAGEVKMAKLLIDQMSGEWDPTEHPNEYRQALEKLLASKRKFAVKDTRNAENVVDLMEALRKSVSKMKKPTSARRSARHAGAA